MLYLFGDCILDASKRELRRAGCLVDIEPQVFDLLTFLIANADRVVTRDELLAEVWHGRIVSESTLSSRINAARTAIGDTGAQQRFIRTLLRKGVRFVGDIKQEAEQRPEAPAPPVGGMGNGGPSIAVLPFTNMSGDVESDYFADGMSEEIITALSHCAGLKVIARNSSFSYKGRAIDVREVGRDLGVGFVLEGSVRRTQDRVRITAQLIEARKGTHLWADRFDGTVTDVFALQDRIAETVACVIEPALRFAESERVRRKMPQNMDAYDLWLQSTSLASTFTASSMTAALRCLDQAIKIEPDYALAMATAAHLHAQSYLQGWVREPDRIRAEALDLAWRALDIAGDDANVQWMSAFAVWIFSLDAQRARELFRRSLEANPNSALALTMAGWVEAVNGNPNEGRRLIERSLQLNPRHPHGWLMSAGMALAAIAGKSYDEAVIWAERALVENRRSTLILRALVVAYVNSGNVDRARQVVRELLAIEPNLTVTTWRASVALVDEDLVAAYAKALRTAGVAE